jgi:uncharacterized protein
LSVFEWDPDKAEQNLRKHQIAFDEAAAALLGLALTTPVGRAGENRLLSLCEGSRGVIAVVWTPRANVIRIISARAASRRERKRLDQALGRSA